MDHLGRLGLKQVSVCKENILNDAAKYKHRLARKLKTWRLDQLKPVMVFVFLALFGSIQAAQPTFKASHDEFSSEISSKTVAGSDCALKLNLKCETSGTSDWIRFFKDETGVDQWTEGSTLTPPGELTKDFAAGSVNVKAFGQWKCKTASDNSGSNLEVSDDYLNVTCIGCTMTKDCTDVDSLSDCDSTHTHRCVCKSPNTGDFGHCKKPAPNKPTLKVIQGNSAESDEVECDKQGLKLKCEAGSGAGTIPTAWAKVTNGNVDANWNNNLATEVDIVAAGADVTVEAYGNYSCIVAEKANGGNPSVPSDAIAVKCAACTPPKSGKTDMCEAVDKKSECDSSDKVCKCKAPATGKFGGCTTPAAPTEGTTSGGGSQTTGGSGGGGSGGGASDVKCHWTLIIAAAVVTLLNTAARG